MMAGMHHVPDRSLLRQDPGRVEVPDRAGSSRWLTDPPAVAPADRPDDRGGRAVGGRPGGAGPGGRDGPARGGRGAVHRHGPGAGVGSTGRRPGVAAGDHGGLVPPVARAHCCSIRAETCTPVSTRSRSAMSSQPARRRPARRRSRTRSSRTGRAPRRPPRSSGVIPLVDSDRTNGRVSARQGGPGSPSRRPGRSRSLPASSRQEKSHRSGVTAPPAMVSRTTRLSPGSAVRIPPERL